jgi:hypothetical protein
MGWSYPDDPRLFLAPIIGRRLPGLKFVLARGGLVTVTKYKSDPKFERR